MSLTVGLSLGLVSACDTGLSPSSSSATSTSTVSSSPSPTSSTAPTSTQVEVTAYYVGTTTRGFRLFKETRTVTTTGSPESAALETAFGEPLDPDYSSVWASLGVTVNSLTKAGGVITVDLHGITGLRARPTGMRSALASSSVDQILWTVKDAFGAGKKVAVQIVSDGSPVDRLLGVPTSEPVAVPDPDSTFAQVWITNIEEGDTVTSPVLVEGLGAAFEAQIVWRVYDESGQLVKHGWTLAEECCRMAPYSFKVKLAAGTYLIVVEDTDPSGGESGGPWQDSKTVTVS